MIMGKKGKTTDILSFDLRILVALDTWKKK